MEKVCRLQKVDEEGRWVGPTQLDDSTVLLDSKTVPSGHKTQVLV